MRVTKEITFDTAHMLTGHEGKCRNLHGHTYHLFVEVCGELNEEGMVVDFKRLKELMHEVVADKFDHAYMYDAHSETERAIATLLERQGLRTVPLSFRTTAENLAKYFFELLSQHLAISAVRLLETPTSCAEYRAEDVHTESRRCGGS